MPLFDTRCTDGHIEERLAPSGDTAFTCGVCGQPARRLYTRAAVEVTPPVDTRGMFRRARESQEDMNFLAEKHEAATGQPVAALPLWQRSKAKARAMIAAGENPVRRAW